jgi:hypothetical protein
MLYRTGSAQLYTPTPGVSIQQMIGATSAPFTPLDLASLQIWLDASDATTIFEDTGGTDAAEADDLVARLSDKSGNGRHFTQSTSGHRPTYKTAVQNGLSVVRFDGVNDWLDLSFSNAVTAQTFVAVFLQSGTQGFCRAITQSDASTDHSTTGAYVPILRNNANAGQFCSYADSGARAIVTLAASTFSIMSSVHSGSVITNRVNGGTAGTYSHSLSKTWTRIRIGDSTGNDAPFTGDLCEVIICNAALSDANLNSLGGYLATKWGLSWTTI